MTARRGQEVARREYSGPDVLPAFEGALPRDVHEMRGAGAPHTDHPALRQGFHQPMAEGDGLLDDRGARGRQVVGMDVDVPEPGQEVGPSEIGDLGSPRIRSAARVENLRDASILDGDARAGNRPRVDAVDEGCIGQHALHGSIVPSPSRLAIRNHLTLRVAQSNPEGDKVWRPGSSVGMLSVF